MRSLLVLLLAFPLFAQAPSQLVIAPPPPAAPTMPSVAPPDPAADALAKRTIEAQGGAAWDKARFFSFTFVVERNGQAAASFPQQWDRVTGNYRVSNGLAEGDRVLRFPA